LQELLEAETLKDKTFLDIGCGSGLFSLSAYMLGAEVTSFDYDPNSVAAAESVKAKFTDNNKKWKISQGSILDEDYIKKIGKFNYVYSWGVLHHTGDMYKSFNNIIRLVKPGGLLTIAIYNTQFLTPAWKTIKKYYISSPAFVQNIMSIMYAVFLSTALFFFDLVRLKNPFKRYKSSIRGMNFYTDIVDWLGGYPFETATPAEITAFFESKNFKLKKIKTVGKKSGCNEFVFEKSL